MFPNPIETLEKVFVLILILLLTFCFIIPPSSSSPSSSSFKTKRSIRRHGRDTSASEDDLPSKPNLLFSKRLLNKIFAIGWNIEVEYQIFNVGDAPAIDVNVLDEDFSGVNSTFEVIEGEASFRVGKMLPGANVTFNVTVLPRSDLMIEGVYEFHPAKVTYRSESDADAEEEIIGWSSLSPFYTGHVNIIPKDVADRLHAPKLVALGVFALMTVPPLWVPLFMYIMHVRKYNNLQKLHDLMKELKKSRKRK